MEYFFFYFLISFHCFAHLIVLNMENCDFGCKYRWILL